MSVPLDCDAGMYCPVAAITLVALSIDGVPCPAGTYMSTTLSVNAANVLDQGLGKSLVT